MAGQPAGTDSPESENETMLRPCPRNEAPPRHECPSRRRNCCQARGTLHRDRQRGQTASRSNFVIVQADAPHRPNGREHSTIPVENRCRPGRRRLRAPGQIDDRGPTRNRPVFVPSPTSGSTSSPAHSRSTAGRRPPDRTVAAVGSLGHRNRSTETPVRPTATRLLQCNRRMRLQSRLHVQRQRLTRPDCCPINWDNSSQRR
jgi:hypothetical protein